MAAVLVAPEYWWARVGQLQRRGHCRQRHHRLPPRRRSRSSPPAATASRFRPAPTATSRSSATRSTASAWPNVFVTSTEGLIDQGQPPHAGRARDIRPSAGLAVGLEAGAGGRSHRRSASRIAMSTVFPSRADRGIVRPRIAPDLRIPQLLVKRHGRFLGAWRTIRRCPILLAERLEYRPSPFRSLAPAAREPQLPAASEYRLPDRPKHKTSRQTVATVAGDVTRNLPRPSTPRRKTQTKRLSQKESRGQRSPSIRENCVLDLADSLFACHDLFLFPPIDLLTLRSEGRAPFRSYTTNSFLLRKVEPTASSRGADCQSALFLAGWQPAPQRAGIFRNRN